MVTPHFKNGSERPKCLVKDDKAKAIGENFKICYKQPRNLKNIVTNQKKPLPEVADPGCSKCGKCKISCPVMQERVRFKSTNTGKSYNIREKLTCDSSFVVYLVTCRGQYVGEKHYPH